MSGETPYHAYSSDEEKPKKEKLSDVLYFKCIEMYLQWKREMQTVTPFKNCLGQYTCEIVLSDMQTDAIQWYDSN